MLKAFKQSSDLVIPRRTHTGAKLFLVINALKHLSKIANWWYTEELTLVRILGEKPFPCLKCPKAFNHCHHLVEHRRTHTEEKHFPCDLFPKAFTTSNVSIGLLQ